MKKSKKIGFAAFVFMVLSTNLSLMAGDFSASWSCTPSTRSNMDVKNSPSKAAVEGNIKAGDITSNNIFINKYGGFALLDGDKVSSWWPSADNGATYAGWANEKEEVGDRYIEFSISPDGKKKVTVTSVSFKIGAGGSNAMKANVYYSTDGFKTKTLINNGSLPSLPSVSATTPALDFSNNMNVVVKSGKNFSVRIYPWFSRSSSSPKFIFLGDVLVKGND